MPEPKNTPPRKTEKQSAHKKRPMLSQQIEKLKAQLTEKEQELTALTERNHRLEEIRLKFQETEQTLAVLQKHTTTQNQTIDELKTQLTQSQRQQENISKQKDLIAELTAKLQEAETELTSVSIKNEHALAQDIVKTHMLAATSVGFLPLPLLDIAALTGTQLSLLHRLCNHYGVEFNEKKSKTLLTSLIGGSLPIVVTMGLSSFAKVIPGIGTVSGGIGTAALAVAVVYATGQVFIRHFEVGGTLEDFNSQHWQSFFKQQLEEGKTFVRKKLDTVRSKTPVNELTVSA